MSRLGLEGSEKVFPGKYVHSFFSSLIAVDVSFFQGWLAVETGNSIPPLGVNDSMALALPPLGANVSSTSSVVGPLLPVN